MKTEKTRNIPAELQMVVMETTDGCVTSLSEAMIVLARDFGR